MASRCSRRAFIDDIVRTLTAAASAVPMLCRCSTSSSNRRLDSASDAAERSIECSATAPPARATGLFYDKRMLEHPHSTETPERLIWIERRLREVGLIDHLNAVDPLADPIPHVARVHDRAHIEQITALERTGPAAELAVAGALGAVRAVCDGKLDNAFCAIRPPGHHATNGGHEQGFCFFSNVAIAARFARAACGIERVLIVDWDYHHGNGTEWAFYDDPSVLFFSTHNVADYPGTGSPDRKGEGAGLGFNINVAMDCGAGDQIFARTFDEVLLPAADDFEPQLVLISAGFDSKRDDQLGCFDITPCGFATLTQKVLDIADKHAGGRLVSLLEGGYADAGTSAYSGLADSVLAHLCTLLVGAPCRGATR